MNNHRPARILIADDEPLYLRTTGDLLRKAGYQCECVPDADAALEVLSRCEFDLILSDLNMPGNLKLELLQQGRQRWPHIPMIVITGVPSLPSAIESVRLGITDYLLKPVKFRDLLVSVQRALALSEYHSDHPLEEQIDSGEGRTLFPSIIGESAAMRELYPLLHRVAASDAYVLITGESGTGKEVIARAIHDHSHRRGNHFQVIDCTAIPESLFESVLFGHVKGSFTGAVKDQPGLLALCDKGTAFIDELGELPAPLQAKLLRVIQEQTFTPVGHNSPRQINTRFLCATNRDLELEVQAGRFRQDLYYRLAVIHLEMPPLRERGEDVILLARHFLQEMSPPGVAKKRLSQEAQSCLLAYSWPGNIRELRNVIERVLALAPGEIIQQEDLPPQLQRVRDEKQQQPLSPEASGLETHEQTLGEAERQYLISLLKTHSGNVSEAARTARLSRQGLHKLLKKHEIRAADYRN